MHSYVNFDEVAIEGRSCRSEDLTWRSSPAMNWQKTSCRIHHLWAGRLWWAALGRRAIRKGWSWDQSWERCSLSQDRRVCWWSRRLGCVMLPCLSIPTRSRPPRRQKYRVGWSWQSRKWKRLVVIVEVEEQPRAMGQPGRITRHTACTGGLFPSKRPTVRHGTRALGRCQPPHLACDSYVGRGRQAGSTRACSVKPEMTPRVKLPSAQTPSRITRKGKSHRRIDYLSECSP